jgi:hypothetical protein
MLLQWGRCARAGRAKCLLVWFALDWPAGGTPPKLHDGDEGGGGGGGSSDGNITVVPADGPHDLFCFPQDKQHVASQCQLPWR